MTSTTTRALAVLAAAAATVAVAALPSCTSATDSGTRDGATSAPAGHAASHNADDVGFAQMMIPHHEQAVELAAMVPDRSADPAILALAAKIAGEQQPEIDTMKALLAQWDVGPMDHGSGHAGMPMAGMVGEDTMIRLESLRGRDFDVLWLQSMIGHHEGAIEMADVEVADGKNPDLVRLARSIISAQQAEIDQMKRMLEAK